jgi:hypothetical protein
MTKRTSAISSILYNHFPFLATTWANNTLRSHSIGAWIEGETPDNKGKRLRAGGSWLGHVIVRASRKRSDLGSNDSTRKISLWVERVVSEGMRNFLRNWKPFYFFTRHSNHCHYFAAAWCSLRDHGAHSLSVWRAFWKLSSPHEECWCSKASSLFGRTDLPDSNKTRQGMSLRKTSHKSLVETWTSITSFFPSWRLDRIWTHAGEEPLHFTQENASSDCVPCLTWVGKRRGELCEFTIFPFCVHCASSPWWRSFLPLESQPMLIAMV